ncbi:hypothetical protein HWV62_15207 [Athelia sp. TMB]|nr:hypothetical protein HWV62_15207 [Athelia sp. TMB]
MTSSEASDLTKLTPPPLPEAERRAFFEHFFRRLAAFRNTSALYAETECVLSSLPEAEAQQTRDEFKAAAQEWAQALLHNAWVACQLEEADKGTCPELDPYAETSTTHLPPLPPQAAATQLLNTILFLHVTTAQHYSARTRTFLHTLAPVDEPAIVATLQDPDAAVRAAAQAHAEHGRALRWAGAGLGAVAGGVLIGVTGGLAAPLVGAGVTSVLGFLGVGGSALGLLAGGLAGSGVVCGALFGAYGARSSAAMVARYTRDVQDLAVVPVRKGARETMAVRLCVSGWLEDKGDVVAPWTVFEGDDTAALQWEVQALEDLANALGTLVKTQAMQYVKAQIIKQTVLAALMSALSPLAWLKIGKIIDNPWIQATQLAHKTGAVLGALLAARAFGARPITLVGYSLGAQVIFAALTHLAALPPAETLHLVQDVFLFGAPVPADAGAWAAARRVVGGRLVNGYARRDYVLAVLARAGGGVWEVAGLQGVEVRGVEDVACKVDGHTEWRGAVGRCMRECGVPGVSAARVEAQVRAGEKEEAETEALAEREEEESVQADGMEKVDGVEPGASW